MGNEIQLDAESYLKSGSNEVRLLEYRTDGYSFGINILKVAKVVNNLTDFMAVPETHPAIRGIFRDREAVVPVIDLAQYLGLGNHEGNRNKIIVTEFFGLRTAFGVDHIDWIHHFKWDDVIEPSTVFGSLSQRYVIGIVQPTQERMVQLLDYETILIDLCPKLQQCRREATKGSTRKLTGQRVLVAEDSPAVRAMLENEFTDRGAEVVAAGDGAQAWKNFQEGEFDLVVCDVEMPQMDGLAVVMNIRQSPGGANTPVIVYSSIGDIGMKARARFLQADAHVTKLNIELLIDTAGRLLAGEKVSFDEVEAASAVNTNAVEDLVTA